MKSFFHIAGYFLLVALSAFGGSLATTLLVPVTAGPMVAWFAKCALVMCLVVALTWVYLRRGGSTWARYGLTRRAWWQVPTGLAGGLLLALAWSIPIYLASPFHWTSNPGFSGTAFVLGTLASIGMGIAEEVGYRTYGMYFLLRSIGAVMAVLVPTAIFVGMHMAGGVPWLAALLVVGSASVMYGCLMLATRSLPFVAAFHIANNLGQDAWLRTSAGSLWQPVFRSDIPADSQPLIWVGMMVLNALVACVAWRVWRLRTRPSSD
ncbi:CPBP family intramembrane glutamic endopeptidase [Luteibacter yeojuensis]|uniref:CPBP family intramembrane metalloprotease n=1 Tax=Luteibacter yeojuensis TaxID=345309 RepID=A0A7X5QSE9_9GAMM|nr:type II CAAX endopeptidase family protein [Luteibacter yeojuensis]NID14514.1 CPBP family intramembrane metalloprotease [Luteibacter yeojuensis]